MKYNKEQKNRRESTRLDLIKEKSIEISYFNAFIFIYERNLESKCYSYKVYDKYVL